MNKTEFIQKLIRGTIRRSIVESTACLVVAIAVAFILPHVEAGSAQYYGCLLVLISTGFIPGVLWAYTLSYRSLRSHPASDTAFWHEALMAQARLLRLVPLWYLAPMCSGLVLFFAPTAQTQCGSFIGDFAVVVTLFAVITWLNRWAAAKIEEEARTMVA